MAEPIVHPLMLCAVCGRAVPANRFSVCSWWCYDTPRESDYQDAPQALAFFFGLGEPELLNEENP